MDIYVGSLPFKIKEKELQELFGKYGKVDAVNIVINHVTRQNKGFAFVTMQKEEEAELEIEALNGTEILDRIISVAASGEKKKEKKHTKFGKGGVNLKGDFDKAKKSFPGKSGFMRGNKGGRR